MMPASCKYSSAAGRVLYLFIHLFIDGFKDFNPVSPSGKTASEGLHMK